MASPSDDQTNSTDTQDSSINIEQIYTNVIQEIDKYRSHISIVSNPQLTKVLINALVKATAANAPANITDPRTFVSNVSINAKPQESRCHTFYRLLGLPVIAPDGSLYSPGFDVDGFSNDIANKHYQVVQKISQAAGLFAIMDDREKNANTFLKIFALSNPASTVADINAGVLALSSVAGGKTRKFSASLENSDDPFDTSVKNQSYTLHLTNSTGDVLLAVYTDASGNHPTQLLAPDPNGFFKESILARRAHILKPFIVDPRVDLTVNPPTGIVAAPFVVNSAKTKYTDDIVLIRPFIEYVARARLDKENVTGTITKRYQDLQDYIQSTDAVKDQDLINRISVGLSQTLEDEVFKTNFNIMRAMIDLLYDSIKKIQETEAVYHWIPIPDPTGLELGVRTQDIQLLSITDSSGNSTAMADPLNRQSDTDIINLTAKIQLSNINAQNVQPDIGSFAFQTIQPLPDNKVTIGFGSRSQNNLDKLTDVRKESTDNAASALRTVEIIMGEFSGLGLCDIIAIYTALWTVDPEVLVNMFDDEAFARLYQDDTLHSPEVELRNLNGAATMSGTDVLQKFEDKIKEMYNLMDKMLVDRTVNNIK